MLRAGLDVDRAFGSGISLDANTLRSAVRLGVVTEADIELALRHLFSVRLRLGHFDPPGPPEYPTIAMLGQAFCSGSSWCNTVGCTSENADNTLPLSTSLSSLAIIGPNADLSKSIAGIQFLQP